MVFFHKLSTYYYFYHFSFANIWTLTQHERAVHRNEYESVCEICGKRLRTAANLKYHMDSIHSTEPRPEVQCTVCHKWLKSDHNLRKHMKSHRDEASGVVFECPHCNVQKKSRTSLSSHILYHHSNRVFTCTMCAKEFKTPTKLKVVSNVYYIIFYNYVLVHRGILTLFAYRLFVTA